MTLLTNLKIAGVIFNYVRCDKFGENKALFEDYNSNLKGHAIFCSQSNQHNGKVEKKFQIFFERPSVMLNSVWIEGLP
jgi:hypothetical protein